MRAEIKSSMSRFEANRAGIVRRAVEAVASFGLGSKHAGADSEAPNQQDAAADLDAARDYDGR